MPISPQEACRDLTKAEQEVYDNICQLVDQRLPEVYQGPGDKVKIEFAMKPGYTERVRQRLFKAYGKAGWKQVLITHPDFWKAQQKKEGPMWIELCAEEPRYCDARD